MSDESKRAYCAVMRDAEVAGKTLVICKGQDSFPTNTERMTGFIDVWWVFDILPARGLLLLIPYLLRHSKVRRCRARLRGLRSRLLRATA
jgi:potassium/chloride transporter 4/5/6